MSKFSESQSDKDRNKKYENIRKEKLADFFYSLAKLTFSGVVIGSGMVWTSGKDYNSTILFLAVIFGIYITYLFASIADILLTFKQ